MTYQWFPNFWLCPQSGALKSQSAQFCQAILTILSSVSWQQHFWMLLKYSLLDPASWPDDPVDDALFKENALVLLCNKFSLSATKTYLLFEFAELRPVQKRQNKKLSSCWMDRPFRDLQVSPIYMVAQGQRSWRTFTKWAMLNICVNRHHGPRSNATLDFHFRDLEMTPSRSSGVKFCMDSGSPISKYQKCFIVTTCLSRTIKKILAIFKFVTFKWSLKPCKVKGHDAFY